MADVKNICNLYEVKLQIIVNFAVGQEINNRNTIWRKI